MAWQRELTRDARNGSTPRVLVCLLMLLAFVAPMVAFAPRVEAQVSAVAPVDFSVPHGLYDAPLEIALTTVTPEATVRYTLDGQVPTDTVGLTLAAGQTLAVSSTTTLRAVAVRDGWQPSPVRTQTYVFTADVVIQAESPPPGWPTDPAPPTNQRMVYGMDPELVAGNEATVEQSLTTIPTLSVVTELPNLFDPATGIYVNGREKGRDWEIPISLELIDPSGAEAGFSIDGGLRIRGASTRNPVYAKHNLGFFFRDEYGGELDYPLFGDEGTSEFEKVDLRSAQGIDWSRFASEENTILRDLWYRDTQAAMGRPYTRSRYYHLYINGQYWGVYLTQERVGDHYGEVYFGGDESDYDVIKHDYNAHPVTGQYPSKRYLATDGDGTAWESLHPLVIDQNVDDAEFATLQAQVDLVSLADYYLLHIWGGSSDGAPDPGTGGRSNNWFALRNRTGQGAAGRWQFFHHDAEASLCVRDSTETDQSTPWDLTSGGYLDAEYMAPPWLHQSLLTHPAYRQIFVDRVALHTAPGGALDVAAATARFDARVAELDGAIDAHAARWGDADGTRVARTKTDWLAAVQAVRDCFVDRAPIVQAQLVADGLWPLSDPPLLSPTPGAVPFGSPVTIDANGQPGEIWYTIDGTDPRGTSGQPSPTALSYTGALQISAATTVRARVFNAGTWAPLGEASYTLSTPAGPVRLLLNEYNAVGGSKFLGGGSAADTANGSDATLGRVMGNGGDWFELVVLDEVDIRGWTFELWHLNNGFLEPSATLEVAQNAPSPLRPGTILTVSEDIADDISFSPLGGDWHINFQANETDAGAYFTAASQQNFAIDNDNTQIAIFDETGAPVALRTGEGTAPAVSVSSEEIFKLEAAPSAGITFDSADYNDGTTSTWGLPNQWGNGTIDQDFSALRVVMGDVSCDGVLSIADAVIIAQYQVAVRTGSQTCPIDSASEMFLPAADLNGSGTVTIADAVIIAQCIVGVDRGYCPT